MDEYDRATWGDLRFDGTKLNIETCGPIAGEFTIKSEVARDYRADEQPDCAGYRGELSSPPCACA